jgi:hypothetical protein
VSLKQSPAEVGSHVAHYHLEFTVFIPKNLVQRLTARVCLVEIDVLEFLHLCQWESTGRRSTAAICMVGLRKWAAWLQLPGADPRSSIFELF